MAATGLEFKNVVFNAARDGKLRRLKVANSDGFVDKTLRNVHALGGKKTLVHNSLVSKLLDSVCVWDCACLCSVHGHCERGKKYMSTCQLEMLPNLNHAGHTLIKLTKICLFGAFFSR